MQQTAIWVLLSLLLILPIQADEGYELREPRVADYLADIAGISTPFTPLQIHTILAEVHHRFAETLSAAPYDLLRVVFDDLYTDFAPDRYGLRLHHEEWERAMLLARLRENAIDLAQNETLRFGNYDIVITAVDFNDAGAEEFVLDVVRGCRYPPCRPATYFYGSADYQEILVELNRSIWPTDVIRSICPLL